MPKGEKKSKRVQKSFLSSAVDEDDVCSLTSDVSDTTLPHNSEDEASSQETDDYEQKIREAMDLALEKSLQTRINALVSLRNAFQKRILTDFLLNNYVTICDLIERSMKKGKGLEQVSAAKLSTVFIIGLINTNEAEEIYKELSPIFKIVVQDPTASPTARQEAALALSFMTFLACPEPSDLPATLNALHNLFCNALPKGNGELPTHSTAVNALHAAALQSVCLLITIMSHSIVYSMAPKLLEELYPVLSSSDLDMRIMVGEAMALIYECAREHSEDFRWKKQGQLLMKLEDLMTESHKYKAKKDRKLQRTSFREIIQSIKLADPFTETVLFGPTKFKQEFFLDNWAMRFQYQALCHGLEQGLDLHMTYNAALRDLYDLGAPPDPIALKGPLHPPVKKPNRQTPEAKARNLNRGKNRDNRRAALNYDG